MRHTLKLAAIVLLLNLNCGNGPGDGDRDADTDSGLDARTDSGRDADRARDSDADGGDALSLCEPPCSPGEACVDNDCIADCRLDGALFCSPPLVCGPVSGACVEPGQECTPFGEFVACGQREFAPLCGPGSVCDDNSSVCRPTEDCDHVVCDAAGICLGLECAGVGLGSVTGVSLEALPQVTPGAEVEAIAHVSGDVTCGVTVTFELLGGTMLYATSSAADTGQVWTIDPQTGDTELVLNAANTQLRTVGTLPSGEVWVARSQSGQCDVAVLADGSLSSLISSAPCGNGATFQGTDAAFYFTQTAAAINDYEIVRADGLTGERTVLGRIVATNIPGREDLGLRVDAAYISDDAAYNVSFGPFVYSETTLPAPASTPALTCAHHSCRMVNGNFFSISTDMEGGSDGRVYVSFRSNTGSDGDEVDGIVWSARSSDGGDQRAELDKDDVRLFDSTVTLANTVGIAVGADGTLYAAHQGTTSLILRRRPGGAWEELASGLALSMGSDLELGTRSLQRELGPIGSDGSARATLTAPAQPGVYQVRVLVTDPQSGTVYTARAELIVTAE